MRLSRAFEDDKMARNFESVSLSHHNVARRVSETNERVLSKLKSIVEDCRYFSIAMDESTDIRVTCQLIE